MRVLAKTDKITVVECEPQVRTVKLNHRPSWYRKVRTFSLPFPYLQFVLFDGTLSVSVRSHPAKSHKDPSYHLPLPNLYAFSGRVCQNPRKTIENAISTFWFSTFGISESWVGSVICDHIFPGRDTVETFETWQSCSPDYMLNHIDWAAESWPVDVTTHIKTVYIHGNVPGSYAQTEFDRDYSIMADVMYFSKTKLIKSVCHLPRKKNIIGTTGSTPALKGYLKELDRCCPST